MTTCSVNFFGNLNKQQYEHLNLFKPCNIRVVFLEKSIPASEDVLAFLNYYKNEAVFILESITGNPNNFITNSTQAITTQQNIRFMTCYAIFYFQDHLRDTTANTRKLPLKLLIREYFQIFTIFVRDENPLAIIFFSFRVFETVQHYTYVQYITTTSSFYVISLDEASLICSTCGRDIVWNVNDFSHSTWRKLHVNYGVPIPVKSLVGGHWDTEQVTPFYACDVFSGRLALEEYPNVDDCFLRVVKQLLNTTDGHNMENSFGVAQFFVMEKSNLDLIFLEKRYIKYEALPYGMSISMYQFGTLTSPNLHDISSLIKPFDVATWFFLVASVFSVCLYFRIVFQLTKQRSVLEIHIISILLEQSQSFVTKYRSHRTQTGGILISWMFLVFITGNAYKGVIFSFLTAISVPVVPDTLEQVMQSDYLLVTMSKLGIMKGDKIIEKSTAKDNIESIMEEVGAGKLKISNSNLYQQFNETLIFLNPATVSGIFLVKETKGVVWGETKYISIPIEVVFFDSDDIVKLFQELNAIFTKNVVVLGETLHFFSTRSQWIFKRNAFLRLILPIVTGLEESGIYTRYGRALMS